MLLASSSWRTFFPFITLGLLLVLIAVALAGRDLRFARSEAEAEVLALAEASALAIELAPPGELEPYLSGLLRHPAIASAVYATDGEQTTRRRAPGTEAQFIQRIIPSLGQPVVACRAVGSGSVCLEGDMAYYRRRLAALLIPHGILLAASALLLVVAMVMGRGSNRWRLAELTRIVRGAAEESNYSLRAAAGKGRIGELAGATNKLLEQMHQRDLILRRRTTELEAANRELEAFSYSVSHDLRAPLASVQGFSEALGEFCGDRLDDSGKEYLRWIQDSVGQMNNLIAGLLQMSRISRSEINRARVDLSDIAASIAQSLRQRDPSRSIDFRIDPGLIVDADERLLRAVLENLMSNAFKFTGKTEHATIAVGSTDQEGRRAYFVRDNGAGFDSTQAARMFTAFQRFHSTSEFEGTGIGLATVRRIIEKHGGVIWADGQIGQGAAFYFTLGETAVAAERAHLPEMIQV